jgi:glycosyltransferase involved in cell wall biosynthesis
VKPKVSICCQTYNHGAYIAQTLDGFLMQKTNFLFEVLVHEDASTDNTAEVLRSYEKKHPDIVKVVYQTENQFLKQNTLVNILFAKSEGDYLALCEGDDYWTDENKLQKQVDFLESNPEYTLTGHSVNTLDNEGKIAPWLSKKGDIDFYNFLCGKNIYTLSLLFRNYKGCFEKVIDPYPAGDFFMKAFMLNRGNGYIFEEVMGVYRMHNTGFWSTRTSLDVHQKTLLAYRYFLKSFPHRKKEILRATLKYKMKYGIFWKTLDSYFYVDIPMYLGLSLKRIIQ